MKPILNGVREIAHRLLSSAGIKRQYTVGAVALKIDYNHRLPAYQAKHPHYDRFLPHLAKYLPLNSVVVDVGANVGDTVAGLMNVNPTLEVICIEADTDIYKDLLANISIIRQSYPDAKIHALNEFVGRDISNVSLVGVGGTKGAVVGTGDIMPESLSEIVANLKVSSGITLLKTDVDGFDYDVIRSADELLLDMPLLYWECQHHNDEQLAGYHALMQDLIGYGYQYFAVFDNFGQYILTADSNKIVQEIMGYIHRQNGGEGSRTMFYIDILAYDASKCVWIDEVVEDYLSQ